MKSNDRFTSDIDAKEWLKQVAISYATLHGKSLVVVNNQSMNQGSENHANVHTVVDMKEIDAISWNYARSHVPIFNSKSK